MPSLWPADEARRSLGQWAGGLLRDVLRQGGRLAAVCPGAEETQEAGQALADLVEMDS